MELASGAYVFPQTIDRGDTEVTINPAAVETSKGVVLLDVGFPGQTEQIEENLTQADLGWDDVAAVVITHQDGDHAGVLSEVVERTDAVVYTHKRCAPYVDGREHPIKSPEDQRYDPVDVDVGLVDGVSFRTDAGPMDVIFTPGHAPGHISLYFPDERLLIAADALTADENGLAGPSEEYTLDMDQALDSAERLTDLSIDRILCYHGGFVEEGTDTIDRIVDSLR